MTRISSAIIVVGLLWGAGPGSIRAARAEYLRGLDGNPVIGADGNLVHITTMESACGPALERFCPELTIAPGQTRNEVMCLKPFRSSVGGSCRNLLDKARKQ